MVKKGEFITGCLTLSILILITINLYSIIAFTIGIICLLFSLVFSKLIQAKMKTYNGFLSTIAFSIPTIIIVIVLHSFLNTPTTILAAIIGCFYPYFFTDVY
jgi:hypothetical protein